MSAQGDAATLIVSGPRRPVALPAGAAASLPAQLRLTAAAADKSLSHHVFVPDIEFPERYQSFGSTVCASAKSVPREVLAVALPAAGPAWTLWAGGRALFAKAGYATVEGVAELRLGGPFLALGPATERADGSVVLYSYGLLDGELCECRFAAPVTEIEPPEGPDDWDDEILVAGPAQRESLGRLEFTPDAGCARVGPDGPARLLFTCAEAQGLAVHQVLVRDGRAESTPVATLSGEALAHARPLILEPQPGLAVAQVLFCREADPPPDAKAPPTDPEVDVCCAVIDLTASDDGGHAEHLLGRVPGPVRSAALAASWLSAEPEASRAAVLDGAGRLWVSEGGRLAQASLRAAELATGTACVPLTLGATDAGAYLVSATADGQYQVQFAD